MSDDPRVQKLLDELLESHATPEQVCKEYPDLLSTVRDQWRRMRQVRADLDAMFPPLEQPTPPPPDTTALPQIPDYEVESLLGRGGMGVVFKARQLKLNRPVALKMLLAADYAAPEELARFRREAEAVAALRHPNIVAVHDAGQFTGRPYFTMEYVESGTLSKYLGRQPQPPRWAAELVATLAAAVQFAHQAGFIHRDLKPSNILLTAAGVPKISDFGLVHPMEAERDITRTGARIGTPGYMAPEQARGDVNAVGPAVDIYALGAVLYEMLTGHLPFEGESLAEVERKLLTEDPPAPSRWLPKVPRDLETICLKCLQKSPARRYASAQDLADDLHRYLDGKPVTARPIGSLERTWKFARRRPTLTTLLALSLVSLGAAIGTGVVLWQQARERGLETALRRERARQAVEDGIDHALKAAKAERLSEAGVILAEAEKHFANADSDELGQRLARAEAELKLAQELDRVRHAVIIASTEKNYQEVEPTDYKRLATDYGKAFASGGFDLDADPAITASQVGRLALAPTVLAALDEWALAEFFLNRKTEQRKLLQIAQLADPQPIWGDRFRDPDAWDNRQKLRKLAEDAVATDGLPPAHQLAIMSTLLWRLDGRAEALQMLRAAQQRRPDDFWLNLETANAYYKDGKFKESVPFRSVLVSLRPGNAWTVNGLGITLLFSGENDEAIAEFRHAIALEPKRETLYGNLGEALRRTGRRRDAVAEWRRFAEAEPDYAPAVRGLADELHIQKQYEKAIPWYRRALDLDPNNADAHLSFGKALRSAGRLAEAVEECRTACRLEPSNAPARYILAYSLMDLRRDEEAVAEFAWIIRELDPKTGRKDAGGGAAPDSKYTNSRNLIVLSLLRLGRFTEARSAARLAQAYHSPNSSFHAVLGHYLDVCRLLGPLESELPKMLAAGELPKDLATRLALAEWCCTLGQLPCTAARLYDAAFKEQPALADQPNAPYRLWAARAAARAGSGSGDDTDKLSEQEKAALRGQALAWLRAEFDVWTRRAKDRKPVQPAGVPASPHPARFVRESQQTTDLAGVRDPAGLARLPEAERAQWNSFWADVNALVLSDPALNLERARDHVLRKEWAEAGKLYARCFDDGYASDGEVCFEHAAIQLLLGNPDGYRQTCKNMLELGESRKMPLHLVVRACTLAPDSVPDMARVSKLAAGVASADVKAHWWQTEQGALCCRTKRYADAVAMVGNSLRATPKPGLQVLDWCWLALARHNLGDNDEARSWLNKAAAWLDAVGDEMPPNAAAMELHRHDWLEAHVLRREAEALIQTAGRQSGTETRESGGPPK
jgi:serine/threonine-protein kinase